ncbi:unnamed protein product, partial [Bubo scandiacus]
MALWSDHGPWGAPGGAMASWVRAPGGPAAGGAGVGARRGARLPRRSAPATSSPPTVSCQAKQLLLGARGAPAWRPPPLPAEQRHRGAAGGHLRAQHRHPSGSTPTTSPPSSRAPSDTCPPWRSSTWVTTPTSASWPPTPSTASGASRPCTSTRCRLASLPSGIFSGLHSLQYLYLQENGLLYLQDDLFADLANLSHLLPTREPGAGAVGGRLPRVAQPGPPAAARQPPGRHPPPAPSGAWPASPSSTCSTTAWPRCPGTRWPPSPALQFLRLNANPWACDCRARARSGPGFRRTRVSSSPVPCASPPHRRGTDLRHLRPRDFDACPEEEEEDEEEGGGGGGGGRWRRRGGGDGHPRAGTGSPRHSPGRATLRLLPVTACPPTTCGGPQPRPPPPSRDSRGPPGDARCPPGTLCPHGRRRPPPAPCPPAPPGSAPAPAL